ncbi:hypothetical protein OEA41_005683 [Lepraria neglecta]|uniref:Dirigent protein n=1 Tax=Lepraria neglecta TaxID=209136 RepID=A0AAE0DJI5_9LECA|nr:hypothetical protein OEA41_005683 [Lepraria neglecta]
MYRHLTLVLAIASTTLAQIPTNTSFQDLTSYLPFISVNTAYIANDTRASAQLANAPANPITIFLTTLDVPFTQFIAEPLPSGVAGQIEGVNIANKPLTSGLLQYLQIDGLHLSSSFNGTQFLTTRFNDTKYESVTGGAKIEVFRNETAFYIGTGISFKSIRPSLPSLSHTKQSLHY